MSRQPCLHHAQAVTVLHTCVVCSYTMQSGDCALHLCCLLCSPASTHKTAPSHARLAHQARDGGQHSEQGHRGQGGSAAAEEEGGGGQKGAQVRDGGQHSEQRNRGQGGKSEGVAQAGEMHSDPHPAPSPARLAHQVRGSHDGGEGVATSGGEQRTDRLCRYLSCRGQVFR